MNRKHIAAVFFCLAPAVPAPPGKSTVAASEPLHSLAFMAKYLPVTIAEDEGAGNMVDHGGEQVQGRVQVLQTGSYTERNCQLFSHTGTASAASKYTSMTQNGVGKACSYTTGKKYAAGTEMHKVFAYNQAQCCNACVATDGCVGATFLTSSKDHSGGMGPQSWEGFGIHTVNVVPAETTGGIAVDKLEENYRNRFGSHAAYDQFMDYSITFFTDDLQSYRDALTKDNYPSLLAQWNDGDKDTWYSLIFLVNRSHHVIELVSTKKPSNADSTTLPQLEQRMSSAHCTKFKKYTSDPVHHLFISSINRATSNMTAIDSFEQMLTAKSTHKIDGADLTRHCFSYGQMLDIELCFTKRTPDPSKDKIFSVVDFEQMMWSEHASVLANDPTNMNDKYTDNHYALPLPQAGLTALSSQFTKNNPYPITKDTRLAYACKQDYIIDPTGWSIQPIGMADWPGCSDRSTTVLV